MSQPILNITQADMTPWFAAGVRPARPGVYQVKIPCPGQFDTETCWICVYSYWSGICWGQYQHSAKAAANVLARDYASKFQSYEWRGLREEFK
jgi:hypothetical protein